MLVFVSSTNGKHVTCYAGMLLIEDSRIRKLAVILNEHKYQVIDQKKGGIFHLQEHSVYL